jgi:hypothetical protein
MGPSERAPSSVGLTVGIAICTSCTLTGLGDYEVDTCSQPAGTTSTVQSVGQLADTPTLSSINGSSPVGAFVGNDCVEGVTAGGNLQSTCSLLAGLSPRQPVVVPIGGSYAAAAIATTSPCVDGQLSFQALTLGAGTGTFAQAAAPCGAALPAVAPLPGDEATLIAWYQTPISTREDPIGSCSGASAAPLVFAIGDGVTTLSPQVGMPTMLTGQATSVRPPGVIPVAGSAQVLVASPDGSGVSVWPINGDGSVGTAFQLPGLSGARAVSGAASPDGRLALAAEIGCAPQSIALALVTQGGDSFRVTTVAAADGAFAVNPTVAWVPSEGYWIVSWISGTGGTAHVVAQRFDSNGNAVGSNIDPSVSALTAAVTAGGALFGYTQPRGMNGTFLNISLGCAK